MTRLLTLVLCSAAIESWAQNKNPVISEEDFVALERELGASEGQSNGTSQAGQQAALSQDQNPVREDQIPVLNSKVEAGVASKSTSERLVWSVVAILIFGLALFAMARYWSRLRPGLTPHHQIKMITQFNLGPRRSLAVVRVAGESILIGITDHHISMIKSLALLDEELPEEVPNSFSQEVVGRTADLGQDEQESFFVSRLRAMRDS